MTHDSPNINFDGGRWPGEMASALRHKTAKAALREVRHEDMPALLADAFGQRWGCCVGVETLRRAIQQLEARR